MLCGGDGLLCMLFVEAICSFHEIFGFLTSKHIVELRLVWLGIWLWSTEYDWNTHVPPGQELYEAVCLLLLA